jgi:hypothetical protein
MTKEHDLLTHVQKARDAFGPKCMKLAGSVAVEVIRLALSGLGITLSARDVFIQGVPVEIDLVVPRTMAAPGHGLIYEPSDVIAAFEIKNSGAFPGAVASIRRSFELIRSANPHIYCGYITLAERRNYKWAATEQNLGADVYTLFWHNGSLKHRRYDPTGDWDRLTGKLNDLLRK